MDYALFKKRLKDRGLNTKQIAIIIEELNAICLACFNGNKNCQCWNDE